MRSLTTLGTTSIITGVAGFVLCAPPAAAQIFTETEVDLGRTGLSSSVPTTGPLADAEWGDYDNDGNLDLIVTGFGSEFIPDTVGPTRTTVFRNDGEGDFEPTISTFPKASGASAAWGDFDGDGDIDLLLQGSNFEGFFTSLFQNGGGGQFQDLFLDLIPVVVGSLDWGDYDNDGDLDILQTGSNGNPYTRLYRNEGNGDFAVEGAGLVQLRNGDATFGDYDADGDLDLVLSGTNFAEQPVVIIYRNNGDGTWTDIDAGLAALFSTAIDLGDYDGDGDLDIVLTGVPDDFSNAEAYIYRNDGDDTFVQTEQEIIGVFNGDAQWGDYDNDADLDLLVAGVKGVFDTERILELYENDGTGNLTPVADTGLPAGITVFDWGDYDSDGDLDLVTIGDPWIDADGDGDDDVSYVPQTIIYRNDSAPPAAAPEAPVELEAAVADGTVTLSWQPASAANEMVTYNLRVGTESGAMDVVSSMTDPDLASRLVAEDGNAGLNTALIVHGLEEGTYYWSVQAIDANRVASEFTVEQAFVVGSSDLIGDLNGDSDVGTADLLLLLAMWGQPDAFPDADLNGDGAIDVGDLLMLLTNWS